MSIISDSLVFSVDYGNEIQEYEIDRETFDEYSAISFGGDDGEIDRDELAFLMSDVIEEENVDFAEQIATSVFDYGTRLNDISFMNLQSILDERTLYAAQDTRYLDTPEETMPDEAELTPSADEELTPSADEELTPSADEEPIDPLTEYPNRVGTYSKTMIPDVMVREKTSGAAYIDREYKAALEDYYALAVEENNEENALETILVTLGYDKPEDFVQLLMDRADEKGMEYLEYLYSYDGALTFAGEYDLGAADGHLSGSEIALASFMEEDGYDVENFIEAYDSLSMDDRNKMISSLFYAEGHDTGGNPIKGMTGAEAATFLFGITEGTAAFGSVTDIGS